MLNKIKESRVFLGLLFTILSAVISFALSWLLFSDQEILSRVGEHLYDCGIDVIGAFVCAALYFGSMRQEGSGSREFRILTAFVSAGFLANGLMFFMGSALGRATLFFVFAMTSKLLDLVMIYFFYRYVRITLDFKGKLATVADKGIPILTATQTLVTLTNIFYPLTFWVDESTVYHATGVFWVEDVCLIVASFVTTILIIRSKSPGNQKAAALIFIFLPLFNYFTTPGEFGNASNYGMILMSLVIVYCLIFNEKSEKLVSTQTELDTAAGIQASMVPSIPPAGETFELHASMNTAKEVGGDFYDCFMIDSNRLCILIADVSGKGMPAALFMMRGTTVIKDNALIRNSTSEILTAANARLCENNDEDMFITAWIGILDTRTMMLQYTNAGHNYPVLLRRGKPCEPVKKTHGLFLAGFDSMQYKHNELKLEPGDRLFLYTDGVTEAHDPVNALYGEDRLNEVLESTRQSPGDQVLNSVFEDIKVFSREAPQFDDITMVVLTIKEYSEACS
ncbi:MAG: serine/threonine-protein phosphatase [Atopobiaceae bacterium]|nr:serine/threonine-protein phosphatase [Atopobiaceae bacterium]